jgi:hypothetical protein
VSALAPIPVQQSPIDARTSRIDGNWLRWLNALKDRAEQSASSGGDITAAQIVSGVIALARIAGLTDAQIAAGAAIAWSKVSKAGSSLADLATRSAADLSSGTLPDARFPATLPAASGANLTALNASNLASGTVADARLSSKVPLDDVAEAISGVWDFSNGLKERGRAAKIGEWTAVAFDAANFTGNGAQTWTLTSGDQLSFTYTLIGKSMTVSGYFNNTTVGGTPNTDLRVVIPGGFVSNGLVIDIARVQDNGAAFAAGVVYVLSAGTTINFQKLDASNWSAATNATVIQFSLTFPVQ